MLFLAGITSSVSIVQPSVAFLEDEYNLTRQKSVRIFAIFAFVLCVPAVLFLHRGVLDDLDFWGGNFIIVISATIEVILLAWIFGINRAWDELHTGAKLRVPRIFRFVIKFVTPTILLVILGYYLATEWWDVITMKGVDSANVPYILGMRFVLLGVLVLLAVLIWIAWRRRGNKEYQEGA
jgi:SNF family Na+-dependent transporter